MKTVRVLVLVALFLTSTQGVEPTATPPYGDKYTISVKIGPGKWDGTSYGTQYVKIEGYIMTSQQHECKADFSKSDTWATCNIYIDEYIGNYECVHWLTNGNDGWTFSQMDVSVNGRKENTWYNWEWEEMRYREKKEFCPPDPYGKIPGESVYSKETPRPNTANIYEVRVTVGSDKYDGTTKPQYVTFWGTGGTVRHSEEMHCPTSEYRYFGRRVYCIVGSDRDIGDFDCLVWRNGGNDGWTITQMDVFVNGGLPRKSFWNINLDIGHNEETKICLDTTAYTISVQIGPGEYDGTQYNPFVKIKGTEGITEEMECISPTEEMECISPTEKFAKGGAIAKCTVLSRKNIGRYLCIIWRSQVGDGWRFTKMDVHVNNREQKTFYNVEDLHFGSYSNLTWEFCPPFDYQITVSLRDSYESRTADPQYVTIEGTLGKTEEKRCDANFNVWGQNVTCSVQSNVNIGEYKCVIWRNGGKDGWEFTQLKMQIDGKQQPTYTKSPYVALNDITRTERLCIPVFDYQITVSIRDTRESRTADPQYVTIEGTLGKTEEKRCDANFNVWGQDVTCSVQSNVNIGEYKCVIWRSGGKDGWEFTQLKMQIDGKEQPTYMKSPYVALNDKTRTERLCISD